MHVCAMFHSSAHVNSQNNNTFSLRLETFPNDTWIGEQILLQSLTAMYSVCRLATSAASGDGFVGTDI